MKIGLFMSVAARKNPIDGGGSFRELRAENFEDARKEAQAIIERRAPEDSCDFYVDFAAIFEIGQMEILRQGW